ncbi:hypothetical protein [Oceanithermus sp.]|uniref:hypothetical protein n=1 Tax=Oceanithermus sp. TaxID=2268145 RepID=UPI00257D2732|nr:hypothetical protein [Oceanithermus sp.]
MRSLAALLLLAALAGCAPQTAQRGESAALVFPGGVVQGRWVETAGGSFPLPAPPLDVDAGEEGLEVLYPYVWQRYQGGELAASYDLPARARTIRARPEPVVLLEDGLYTPESGWRAFPARDAVRTAQGTFWVNDEGLWRGPDRLRDGDFERVVALGRGVLALGRGRALLWPAERELELPEDWTAADAAGDLYLLTPAGVHRYDPEGYELGFYAGAFRDLAASRRAGVWLLTPEGEPVHLTLELEEAW